MASKEDPERTRVKDIAEVKMVGIVGLSSMAIVSMLWGDGSVVTECVIGIGALGGISALTKK